jgi:hypothetical protein
MSQVADYMQIYRAMTTPQLISEAWDNRDISDSKLRDRIVTVMLERERKGEGAAVWPSAAVAAREEMAGLYPDPADPQFAARHVLWRRVLQRVTLIRVPQQRRRRCLS